MQGVIFLNLQKFVRERFGESLWTTIQQDAGAKGHVYLPSQTYPADELVALTTSLSRHSGMSTNTVLESFGDTLAEALLAQYGCEIDPRFRLLDVLAHADEIIERIEQKAGNRLLRSPIAGHFGREGEVLVSYQSPLPLCALIKGVIRGLGATLDQPMLIEEKRCMALGATSCELAVRPARERPATARRRLTPPPLNASAIKAAMLAGERGDRPSQPPSLPPPSLPPSSKGDGVARSGVRSINTSTSSTIPPASGVTSSPSTPPARISELPTLYTEPSDIGRKRS